MSSVMPLRVGLKEFVGLALGPAAATIVLHAPSGAWAVRRSRAARAALVTDKSCSGIDYNTSTTVGAPKERDSIAIPK